MHLRSSRRTLLLLATLFGASRLAYFLAGLRFDASTLGIFWQYLDPQLLETDLLSSLWFLHSQPPLFNLFLGLLLKLTPGTGASPAAVWTLAALFHLLGFAVYAGSFALMRRLGVSWKVALLLSTLLVMRPGFVIFEDWLMYDVPVAALLVASALLLHRAAQGHPRAVHAFFWVLAALCWTRGFFHLLFFLAVVGLMVSPLVGRPPALCRRRWLVAALGPGLLVAGLYTKNLVLFEQFGPSSWLGMNLARIATSAMTEEELASLSRGGDLSPIAATPPFAPLRDYPAVYRQNLSHPEIPALAAERKTNGQPNYNHEAYLRIGRQYRHDALWLIRHRPKAYLHGVAKAIYNYTKPPGEIPHVAGNRNPILGLTRVTDAVLYGAIPGGFRYGGEIRTLYVLPLLLIPALFVYALLRAFREADPQAGAARRTVLLYLALTLAYVTAVGVLCEVWENGRFRFYIDPFFATLAALWVDRWRRRSR